MAKDFPDSVQLKSVLYTALSDDMDYYVSDSEESSLFAHSIQGVKEFGGVSVIQFANATRTGVETLPMRIVHSYEEVLDIHQALLLAEELEAAADFIQVTTERA